MNADAEAHGAGWGEPAARGNGLEVWLRASPPAEIAVGDGSALFLHGAALHQDGPIEALELRAGAAASPAMAARMPSPSLARERPDDPAAGRAIFWGLVALAPERDTAEIPVELVARLEGGRRSALMLGGSGIAVAPTPPAASGEPGTVAICMATYEPPTDLFERQVESLRAQTHDDWTCLISDDASSAAARETIDRVVGSDPRFQVAHNAVRLGAYDNFGRALAMAPADVAYVAPCDQDDIWHPEKLESLIGAIGSVHLAFSDMRVVDRDGSLVSETYWTTREPNHESFASLLLGNTVTGAASLLRRELLDDALPLPPRVGNLYHDHWLALVARATGEIAYVPRPLHDYVQHADAVIGHAAANRGIAGGGTVRRAAGLRRRDRARLSAEWRRIYFAEYCRMAASAIALERRLGSRIGPAERRTLHRALALDRSAAAVAWLTARQLRRLRRDDTGGSEAGMLRGLAWRRLIGRRPADDADLPPGIVGIDPSPARDPIR